MNLVKGCLLLLALFLSNTSLMAGGIGDLFGGDQADEGEILRPEVAFQFFPEAYGDGQLIVNVQIEPGYYLYRDKLNIVANSEDISLGDIRLPAGKTKEDPVFGQVEVYESDKVIAIPFTGTSTLPSIFDISIAYQGCKDKAVCYPPLEQAYAVAVNDGAAPALPVPGEKAVTLSASDSITVALKEKGLLLNVLSFFGFGFLLALTPCVFPMIPILSGILVGQAERITRSRAFMLSLFYVLAMALTYAVLGVVAGIFGINLQAASQQPWVLILFSLVFVLLALSMFGFYELQIPASWQAKLLSGKQQGKGTLKSAMIMGVLSAIIVGPCVAPPLAGALLYISQTGDAILGGLALFAMGLGFGVPLLVVGATSGELLPRAGKWMNAIKATFGVIMLGVAIWFLERIVPDAVALLLWALLFVGTAVFIGALDRIDAASGAVQRLRKALGIVLLVYGIVLVVAAANGSGSVLKPFKSFAVGQGPTTTPLPFERIDNMDELQVALEESASKGQLVMLDFYADWCIACIELEEYTFPEPAVKSALSSFRLLQADVTANNDQHKALLEEYELFGPPAILFFNTNKQEIRSHRLVGFIEADEFVAHVNQVKRQ